MDFLNKTIPSRFLDHFRGNITGAIKLESPNGHVYDVEVTKHRNKTLLGCGWKTYVDAHDIVENDSVMFYYRRNSRFATLIFDLSGCEKVFSCAGTGTKTAFNVQQRGGDSSVDSLSSSDDTDTQSSGSERSSSTDRKTATSTGESGEDSPPEHGSVQADHRKAHSKLDYVIPSRCYLTKAQKLKMAALVKEIQPEIPLLVIQMKKSNVNARPTQVISKSYARAHFPHESQTITLKRPGEHKNRHPKLTVRGDRSGFLLHGRRWSEFVRDNGLQQNDICLLQPTKSERRFTVLVHLLDRANTKATTAFHVKEKSCDRENAPSLPIKHDGCRMSDDSQGPSEPPSYVVLGSAPLSPAQEKIVDENVTNIQSEVPIFVATMDKSNIGGNSTYALDLSTRYSDLHLPGGKQTLMLRQAGWRKTWRAEMHDGRLLAGDWHGFTRDSRLQTGDICLFEPVKNETLAMTVHIIRSEQYS